MAASFVYIPGRLLLGSGRKIPGLFGPLTWNEDVKENLASRPAHAAHSLAGKVMSGAEIIVQVLADEGVETVFGYSGGAILPTYDAIFVYNQAGSSPGHKPMPLVVPANEQGAGFMAAGYARATGKVGVCVVTSGP